VNRLAVHNDNRYGTCIFFFFFTGLTVEMRNSKVEAAK